MKLQVPPPLLTSLLRGPQDISAALLITWRDCGANHLEAVTVASVNPLVALVDAVPVS